MARALAPGSRLHQLLQHYDRQAVVCPVRRIHAITALLVELDLVTYRGDLSAVGRELLALLDGLADLKSIGLVVDRQRHNHDT